MTSHAQKRGSLPGVQDALIKQVPGSFSSCTSCRRARGVNRLVSFVNILPDVAQSAVGAKTPGAITFDPKGMDWLQETGALQRCAIVTKTEKPK